MNIETDIIQVETLTWDVSTEGNQAIDEMTKRLDRGWGVLNAMQLEEGGKCTMKFFMPVDGLEDREYPFDINNGNNFCRIFEMPQRYPDGYCFGGKSYPAEFRMVDFFNPIPPDEVDGKLRDWGEYERLLKLEVLQRPYIKRGFKYLMATEFGAAIIIERPPLAKPPEIGYVENHTGA